MGKSPVVDEIYGAEPGGGGRGGGLCDLVAAEPDVTGVFVDNIFEVLGAGVGLELLVNFEFLGDAMGARDVLVEGDGVVPIPDDGGGGAGLFFRLFAVYELSLLPEDNDGEGGERIITPN